MQKTKQPYLSKYKRSAIIGYHRSGVCMEWISVNLFMPYEKVKMVIDSYFVKPKTKAA